MYLMTMADEFTRQVRIDTSFGNIRNRMQSKKQNIHPSNQYFLQTILSTTPV